MKEPEALDGQDKSFRTQGLELEGGLEDAREKGVNKEPEGFVTRSRVNTKSVSFLRRKECSLESRAVNSVKNLGSYYHNSLISVHPL